MEGKSELHIICRDFNAAAPALYLALKAISKGRKAFVTSRKEIFEASGIPPRRITKLLANLHESSWITRTVFRRRTKTGFIKTYRISIDIDL